MEIKFEWTPEISVGNQEIDNQHKQLLEKINELLQVIIDQKGDEFVGEVLDFLEKYIKEHLIYEENYMREKMFPGFKEHQEIHQNFIDKYQDFRESFGKYGSTKEMLHEVEAFLGDWWIRHIGVEDKKYAVFIEENNL